MPQPPVKAMVSGGSVLRLRRKRETPSAMGWKPSGSGSSQPIGRSEAARSAMDSSAVIGSGGRQAAALRKPAKRKNGKPRKKT